MAFIDMVAYRNACNKARELVRRPTLMEAIHRVYDMWLDDRATGNKVVFHAYFGLSLLDLGIDELFTAEQYRKALAAYFQPRALKKLAAMRKTNELHSASRNPVEIARRSFVRIRVTESVSLEFRAINSAGYLKWGHVVEGDKVIHFGNSGDLDDTVHHAAHKQALAVMNEKRGYKSKKRN